MRTTILCHLTIRRTFVFLDEWLSYYLLWKLYKNKEYRLLSIIIPLAIFMNAYGYHGLWNLRRFYGLPI